MNVLVTGGAGYIGSHAVKALIKARHTVTVLDNLCNGHRAAVHPDATLCVTDLSNRHEVRKIIETHQIECVMHFAAFAQVGESVQKPLMYYRNNFAETLALLEVMQSTEVNRFVFSSTCAVYGEPDESPIRETTRLSPINSYGQSKRFIEQMLFDYGQSNPTFGFTCLRYFNVAGCALDGTLGEDHDPETHLIPVLLQATLGQREGISIFGTDYPTADGTCIRDYIHVEDLCTAHIAAMDQLKSGDQKIFNLGIGKGYSVREVIDACQRVTGKPLKITEGDRREGDPPCLYANADLIRQELGWSPSIIEIEAMIDSAWNWFQKHPHGYQNP